MAHPEGPLRGQAPGPAADQGEDLPHRLRGPAGSVTAILPEDGSEDRARELLRNAALAYQGYDNPAGASFKVGKVRPAIPVTGPFPPARGMLQARNVLGARELAALWHPLGGGDQLAGVPRSGARMLHPPARAGSGGA